MNETKKRALVVILAIVLALPACNEGDSQSGGGAQFDMPEWHSETPPKLQPVSTDSHPNNW